MILSSNRNLKTLRNKNITIEIKSLKMLIFTVKLEPVCSLKSLNLMPYRNTDKEKFKNVFIQCTINFILTISNLRAKIG